MRYPEVSDNSQHDKCFGFSSVVLHLNFLTQKQEILVHEFGKSARARTILMGN